MKNKCALFVCWLLASAILDGSQREVVTTHENPTLAQSSTQSSRQGLGSYATIDEAFGSDRAYLYGPDDDVLVVHYTQEQKLERRAKLNELGKIIQVGDRAKLGEFVAQNSEFIKTIGDLFGLPEKQTGDFSIAELIRDNNVEAVRILLDAGMPFDEQKKQTAISLSPEYRPWLWYARSIPMVELFLEYGENINAQTSSGQTLLVFMTQNEYRRDGTFPLTRWLVQHGANVNLRGSRYNIPFLSLCETGVASSTRNFNGLFDLITLFLTHGADTTVRNSQGEDCWDILSEELGHVSWDRQEVKWKSLYNLYHALDVVDVSQFPTEYPQDPKTFLDQTKDNKEFESSASGESPSFQAMNKFETALSQYWQARLQVAYQQFQKGDPEPLRQLLFYDDILAQHPGDFSNIIILFKSPKIFYQLFKWLVRTPKEKKLVKTLIEQDMERHERAMMAKEDPEQDVAFGLGAKKT